MQRSHRQHYRAEEITQKSSAVCTVSVSLLSHGFLEGNPEEEGFSVVKITRMPESLRNPITGISRVWYDGEGKLKSQNLPKVPIGVKDSAETYTALKVKSLTEIVGSKHRFIKEELLGDW